jgi:hypothetical protein
MTDFKVKIQLDWIDTDDIPQLREQVEEFVALFGHDGLHTGGIYIEGVEGPADDGTIVLDFSWVDLDDVPELLVAIEDRLVLSGDSTGTVCIDSMEFV